MNTSSYIFVWSYLNLLACFQIRICFFPHKNFLKKRAVELHLSNEKYTNVENILLRLETNKQRCINTAVTVLRKCKLTLDTQNSRESSIEFSDSFCIIALFHLNKPFCGWIITCYLHRSTSCMWVKRRHVHDRSYFDVFILSFKNENSLSIVC